MLIEKYSVRCIARDSLLYDLRDDIIYYFFFSPKKIALPTDDPLKATIKVRINLSSK